MGGTSWVPMRGGGVALTTPMGGGGVALTTTKVVIAAAQTALLHTVTETLYFPGTAMPPWTNRWDVVDGGLAAGKSKSHW